MDTLWQDVRYAWRQLQKTPGLACTAVVILALGIGGTTAIFSALNPILFESLPYPQAKRIMAIWYAGEDGSRIPQAFHTYRELSARSRSFESFAVMKPWQPTLVGTAQPERLEGQQVSVEYFRTLGVTPAFGRDLQSSDVVRNGPKVVILSNGFWKRRFGADPEILGRDIKLEDSNYTVIGVMPASFDNVLAPASDVWSALQYDPTNITSQQAREWGHHLRMIGRLRSGISLQQAKDDLASMARTAIPDFPRPTWASLSHGLILDRLQDDLTRSVRPALMAVFGAVLLVLLIACVNVTNLLLARGAQRRGEFAMRTALGAPPQRLMRQLVTESLLLAILGGGLGMIVASYGVRILIGLSPAELPRISAIHVNGEVFAFAFLVTLLVGLIVGLVPARYASSNQFQEALQQSSSRTVGSHQLTRRTLVVAEVALAFVLMVSTGLLFRSLWRLFSVAPGFNPSHVLSMQIQTYGARYADDARSRQYFSEVLDAVREVPGVTDAAFTSQLPLSGDSDVYGVSVENDPPGQAQPVFRYAVTPEYFRTIGIPLHHGRLLDSRDTTGAPLAIVISDSFAKRRFAAVDPIGRRLRVGAPNSRPFTIVGVVGDVKQMSLAMSDSDAVYTTTDQWHWAEGTLSLVVRSRGDLETLVPAVKNAVWSLDKDQPIVRIATLDDLLAKSEAERRFVLTLFEAFGLLALVLAATGIYGILAGSVSERFREIGVRAALGASPADILRLVFQQGMAMTAFGVAIGVTSAWLASQGITNLLFGISQFDLFTYVAVVALLAAVSALACILPAWRAARVDPMIALRCD